LFSKRKKHPNQTVEEAIKYAEQHHWRVKLNKKGHAWGRIYCPAKERGGCIVSVWSTPRVAEHHAAQINRRVDNCEHGIKSE